MKKLIASLAVLGILAGFTAFHTIAMQRFGEGSEEISREIEAFVKENRWDEAEKKLSDLEKLWNEKRTWAALTMRTNVIEEIDTSLKQSKIYARLEVKPDFFGEFIMLKCLLEHIPHQEGLHIEEVL